jgi:hypothetical protein
MIFPSSIQHHLHDDFIEQQFPVTYSLIVYRFTWVFCDLYRSVVEYFPIFDNVRHKK